MKSRLVLFFIQHNRTTNVRKFKLFNIFQLFYKDRSSLIPSYLVIITDERNQGAENAVNAAIEYVHANDMATVNSKTFIKLAESPRQTVEKGLRKDQF